MSIVSRLLLCSFSFVLLYPTAIDLYLVGLPQIANDLGATESQLHTAFSIYLGGMASTMLIAGKLADTTGRKPVAIAGALLFILSSLYTGAANEMTNFLAGRFFQGIGAGFCYTVAFAILRDVLSDERRAKVLSMINGITCTVPVLAPVIGHLVMIYLPWQSLFTAMAVMGGVVFLLATLVLKETKQTALPVKGGASKQESFTHPYFISRLAMTTLGIMVILTYVNTSPMLIMGMLDFDRAGYSSIMALTALIGMGASFSAPILLSRFKQNHLIIASQVLFLLSAFGLSAAYLLQLSSAWFVLAFTLLCAGFSIGFGVGMSQALSPFSQHAGMASSLLCVCQVTGSAAYIWLMGLLGVSALSILIFALLFSSILSLALLLWMPNSQARSNYEKATYSS